LGVQVGRLPQQIVGGAEDLVGTMAGFTGGRHDVVDRLANLLGAGRGLADVTVSKSPLVRSTMRVDMAFNGWAWKRAGSTAMTMPMANASNDPPIWIQRVRAAVAAASSRKLKPSSVANSTTRERLSYAHLLPPPRSAAAVRRRRDYRGCRRFAPRRDCRSSWPRTGCTDCWPAWWHLDCSHRKPSLGRWLTTQRKLLELVRNSDTHDGVRRCSTGCAARVNSPLMPGNFGVTFLVVSTFDHYSWDDGRGRRIRRNRRRTGIDAVASGLRAVGVNVISSPWARRWIAASMDGETLHGGLGTEHSCRL